MGYQVMKVYGPYKHTKNGRNYVIIHKDGIKKSTQYARFLIEQKLGRSLTSEETVDHIDNDFTNDDISNLQVLSLIDNIKKSIVGIETVTFICPICNEEAIKPANYVKHNRKLGKAGPFCSRSCAGKYSTNLSKEQQLDRMNFIKATAVRRTKIY